MNSKKLSIRLFLALFALLFLWDETESLADSFNFTPTSSHVRYPSKRRLRPRRKRGMRRGKKGPQQGQQQQTPQENGTPPPTDQANLAPPSSDIAPPAQGMQAVPQTEGIPTHTNFGNGVQEIPQGAAGARPIAPGGAPQAQQISAVVPTSSAPYIPANSKNLIPANLKGSPAFNIGIGTSPNFKSENLCLATLTGYQPAEKPEYAKCTVTTAAHCFVDSNDRNGNTVRKAQVQFADFGQFKNAVVYFSKKYVQPLVRQGAKLRMHDSAIVTFQGEGCYRAVTVKKVPVIPVSEQPVQMGETLLTASHLQPGLFTMKPYVDNLSKELTAQETRMAITDPKLRLMGQGDSGGPLLRKKADGSLELVGIVSSGTSPGATSGKTASFSTKETIAWTKQMSDSLNPALVATASNPLSMPSLPGTPPASPADAILQKNQEAQQKAGS